MKANLQSMILPIQPPANRRGISSISAHPIEVLILRLYQCANRKLNWEFRISQKPTSEILNRIRGLTLDMIRDLSGE
jgi:antitoxin component HigA of HigAB toxin-antitoxin module